jgi:hypothetical protein
VIEPRERAIVDGESEAAARRQAESDDNRRTDRPAMRDCDDILARVSSVHLRDTRADAFDDVDKTFAVRRALVRGGVPERIRLLLPAEQKALAIESLPIAEMLLGKVFVLVNFRRREMSRRLDRLRRLHRA